MTNEPLATITWHDARQMAQVLEGVPGALREGFPYDREDFDAIAETAQWIWQAGPHLGRDADREFRVAQHAFDHARHDHASGLGDLASLEMAANRMAGHLRRLAKASQAFASRKELPFEVGQRVDLLARTYARFAPPDLNA